VALPVMMSPIITRQPPHMPVPSIMIGVQTDDRADVFLPGHLGDRLHHHDWARGHKQVDAGAVLHQLAEFVGDKTFVGAAAIVGGDHEQVAHRAHFRFKNGQFFMASADDREDPIPGALSADATAYHHHGAVVCDL